MDDQVISQTDVIQRTAIVPPEAAPERAARDRPFASLLESLREARGWSKADLAKRAELDPSSITRFEQGSRHPDRDIVLQLAEAMVLPLTDRDHLLAAAGYRSELWDDPLLIELSHVLADGTIAIGVRNDVRTVLKAALSFARQSRLDP